MVLSLNIYRVPESLQSSTLRLKSSPAKVKFSKKSRKPKGKLLSLIQRHRHYSYSLEMSALYGIISNRGSHKCDRLVGILLKNHSY